MKRFLQLSLVVFLLLSVTGCKHEHEWSEWETVYPATTMFPGERTRHCNKCDATEKEQYTLETEDVEVTTDNFHDYFEYITFMCWDEDAFGDIKGDPYIWCGWVLKDEYIGRLAEVSVDIKYSCDGATQYQAEVNMNNPANYTLTFIKEVKKEEQTYTGNALTFSTFKSRSEYESKEAFMREVLLHSVNEFKAGDDPHHTAIIFCSSQDIYNRSLTYGSVLTFPLEHQIHIEKVQGTLILIKE